LIANCVESFGLIDEKRILVENDPEGMVMDISAKREEPALSTSLPCFLVTTIGGRYLAFEAECIQGVLTKEDIGFLRDPIVQGVPYRMVDLALRLALPNRKQWDGTDVVLLAEGKCQGGVRVQKVHGMLEIQQSQILPLPAQFCGPERRWYRGMILFDRSVALILNTAWVLEGQIEGEEASTESQGMESIVAWQGAALSKKQAC
jgi:hypothetical protein